VMMVSWWPFDMWVSNLGSVVLGVPQRPQDFDLALSGRSLPFLKASSLDKAGNQALRPVGR